MNFIKSLLLKITSKFGYDILRKPSGQLRHFIPTYAYSVDETDSIIEKDTVDDVLNIIKEAFQTTIYYDKSLPDNKKLYNIYPGEHYRLLKAMARVMKCANVVEIGTYTGMGSYSLVDGIADSDGVVHTFDIIDWDKFETHLNHNMFLSGKIKQYNCDLSNKKNFINHIGILKQAELIFMDGPKDGVFEYKFLELLSEIKPDNNKCYLLIDDIRFQNMIELWNYIGSPKLDITSFGHWSGSGLVDISSGLILKQNI